MYFATLALVLGGVSYVAPKFFGQVAHATNTWSVNASSDDSQCVSTKLCATIQAAIDAANPNDTILVSGTFGSTDAYTVYNVKKAITIRGVNTGSDKAKVFGTFLLYVDGVTIDNLSITNKGVSHPDKNAINLLGKQVTITNNDFSLGNGTGGVANGVVIWPYGSNAVSLNITGNTFTGYNLTVPGWSSTALFVAEEINATPFIGAPMSTTLVVPNEESFANGNTYINNSYDYVHQNWGSGGNWSYSRVSNSAGLTDAIDNSAADATILMAGNYTYTTTGQIVISKNLTITGADKATTIINPNYDTPASGDARGWFLVPAGITFNISNVTLDGAGHQIGAGIYYWGNGTVNNCNITGIKYNESTDYLGRGVFIKGNVNVTNSTFTNIGRDGIQYYGGSGTASGNTYTGKGAGDWLDYAFDIDNGAIVTIKDNIISNNTGVSLKTPIKYSSAAIEVATAYGPGAQATITGNNVTGNTIGIAVVQGGSDKVIVQANNNNLSGNSEAAIETFDTTNSVDATNNWWGDSSGPYDNKTLSNTPNYNNPSGKGDAVTPYVDYRSWYTDAGMTTLSSADPTTEAAFGETTTDATVNGTNGDYDASNTSFWWGTSPAGSFTSAVDPSSQLGDWSHHDTGLGAKSASALFSYALTGLTLNTTYYYVAWSEVDGIWYPGEVKSFTTTSIPDTTPPVITLTGSSSILINVGETFTDPGSTTDDSSNVKVSGSVNTAVAGVYVLSYNSVDAAGNPAKTVSRTVTVKAADVVPVVVATTDGISLGGANTTSTAPADTAVLGSQTTSDSASAVKGSTDTKNTNPAPSVGFFASTSFGIYNWILITIGALALAGAGWWAFTIRRRG